MPAGARPRRRSARVLPALALLLAVGACVAARPAPSTPSASASSAPASASAASAGASSAAALASASASASASRRVPCEGDDFGLPKALEPEVAARIATKRGTMGTATKQMVASSHHLATAAGLAILRAGGNAADAFVAATLVQDVVLPGVTSTAGLTGVLVYEAKTKQVTYVHGGVADAIDPARRYRFGETSVGKQVLVPGAPAAYAEIVKRFGKKPLTALVEPAAKLAGDGFPADRLYARSIERRRGTLEKSAYGRKSFFHDGKPVAVGETLKQPEFASTLRSYGRDPTWFYRGPWAREAVALASANGGALIVRDFETYAPEIAPATHGAFMGDEVYAGGHGGAKLLVTLGALEILRGGPKSKPVPPVWAAADSLEMLLRVQAATAELPILSQRDFVMRGSSSAADLHVAAMQVAAAVAAHSPAAPRALPGSHSSAVVVVDAEGNIVVGTHTIETTNWGEALFVGGVPLSTSAAISFDDAALAQTRVRIDPLTNSIAFRDGLPRVALAVYGTGLHLADVEILDSVITRGLDAEDAVLEPRVGFFAFDMAAMKTDTAKHSVDPRFDPALLCTMKQRGFVLERSMPGLPAGFVDTGFPTLVTLAPGVLHGMTPDPPHIEGVAAGD